ncbi:MAG: bifunctional folylpolyglutamate synthase/dihydrofolate synthase [Ruminococcaceae bacterium]|nr:bifunctional folylpolyglutamate synthase/dihydrofolate synthase [Oscillospiraceae bacterium]
MNYEESLQYIHSINWSFCNLGLERIAELCHRLGDPQDSLKFVHVAGTNGKGSVCAMLGETLREAGYRTGLYTSPYIREFNERMKIDGEMISKEELAELTTQVRPIADAMEDKPTEFELITAIAFEYFRRHKCDVVVLEVGLGGRLDSTNIIKAPILSVITGIDFDHVSMLGNTIQEIAAEKAGIIKEGCPCLYGGTENAAYRTIRAIADKRHAPFYTVDRSSLRRLESTLGGTVFDFGEYKALQLSLLGAYQPYNATIVLSAVEILKAQGFTIEEEHVRRAFSSVRWMARFECISKEPTVIYDGGHNPQGVFVAVQSIREYFPEQRVNILSGVMADKDYDAMIEELKPVTRKAFTVTPHNPRALSAEEYAAAFGLHKVEAVAFSDIGAAVSAAIAESREERIPLICLGSLYLYSDVYDAVKAVLKD